MYSFFKTFGAKKNLVAELPALFTSFMLAELLYKFGSFTLECLAFLATWFVTSFLINSISSFVERKKE